MDTKNLLLTNKRIFKSSINYLNSVTYNNLLTESNVLRILYMFLSYLTIYLRQISWDFLYHRKINKNDHLRTKSKEENLRFKSYYDSLNAPV